MRSAHVVIAFAVLLGTVAPSAGLAAGLEDEAVEIGPGITPPRLQSSRSTRYPSGARPATGIVVLRALIDRNGRVRKSEVVSSPDDHLSKAATSAMKAWRYAPAMYNAAPVVVWWTETFQFIPPENEIAAILACDPASIDPGTIASLDDVVLPTIVRKVSPTWTGAIYAQGRSGHVELQCVIDVCGRVGKCESTESSGPEYTAAAIAAVQKRLYRPATVGGKPVAIVFTIRVDFKM